ncbi:MAG: DsrE family protein [Sphingomonadales bacterium]|jgi:intracellular sulfur oxidation DsrE/DsrF family protein
MLRAAFLATLLIAAPASAQDRSSFVPGPVLPDVGPIAMVDSDVPIPKGTKFKIAFDVSAKNTPGQLSRQIETAARTLNMHVAGGVPQKDVAIVLIFHGPSLFDLLNAPAYAARTEGKTNASADAVTKLIGQGVEFIVCGQSAASLGVKKSDLLPGVKLALSAITAHALYQQRGYTLNPF